MMRREVVVDALDRTRLAGSLVDLMEGLGCSVEDMTAVSQLMRRHLELKGKYDVAAGFAMSEAEEEQSAAL
jgi:hypothetical protein